MDIIADILLISGAGAAALYCIILARRLRRFNDLEKGVGGAIAVLSSQVNDMTKTLESARSTAEGSNESLISLTIRAEDVAKRLELLVASMHDLPPEDPLGKSTDKEQNKSVPSGKQSSDFKTTRVGFERESA